MQLKLIILLLPMLLSLFLSIGSMPEPSNPPTGNTAAPGETACMLSGCHSGGTFNGTVNISGVPDTVFTNQTYNITITNQDNKKVAVFKGTVYRTSKEWEV